MEKLEVVPEYLWPLIVQINLLIYLPTHHETIERKYCKIYKAFYNSACTYFRNPGSTYAGQTRSSGYHIS